MGASGCDKLQHNLRPHPAVGVDLQQQRVAQPAIDHVRLAHAGAQDPLAVTGPPGTRDRLQALWSACYADAAAKDLPFPLEVRELGPGDSAEVCGRRVEALLARFRSAPSLHVLAAE